MGTALSAGDDNSCRPHEDECPCERFVPTPWLQIKMQGYREGEFFTFQMLPRSMCGKLVAGVVPAVSPADKQIVANMTGVLVQAAHPKRIILFGSQARGDSVKHSDFDIMVVEEKPANRFAEMVRLNRLIRSFDIAVDLLVVSDEKFQYWRDTPGNVYYEAATGGRSSIKRREQA